MLFQSEGKFSYETSRPKIKALGSCVLCTHVLVCARVCVRVGVVFLLVAVMSLNLETGSLRV